MYETSNGQKLYSCDGLGGNNTAEYGLSSEDLEKLDFVCRNILEPITLNIAEEEDEMINEFYEEEVDSLYNPNPPPKKSTENIQTTATMGANVFKGASIFITSIISLTVLYIVIKYIK